MRCKPRTSQTTARDAPLLSGPPLLTLSEVASHLGVSQATLRRWRQREPLPVIRMGRTIRILPMALQQWLKRRAQSRP
ncbi:MAG TPA: helix-turn-helix domain-containing protein [Ktedonobacteraceae bacterium]|jgi:excisionase family DNA binding protein|nr:helix-turn-helix domain-containing protein [Ktedonobacteraceae bacterium]